MRATAMSLYTDPLKTLLYILPNYIYSLGGIEGLLTTIPYIRYPCVIFILLYQKNAVLLQPLCGQICNACNHLKKC